MGNGRNVSRAEHVAGYRQRLVRIYIGLLDRNREKAHGDDDYALYVWPSTRVGDSGDLDGLVFLIGHEGYFEWFNEDYDVYMFAMYQAVKDAVRQRPEYEQHLVFVDTSTMSTGHRNMFYGDGLHYGSGEQRDGIKRSPLVRDMMMQAVLNE